jgi:hypothetical protein
VRAQKTARSSQSSGSSFVPHRSKNGWRSKCSRALWGSETRQWGSGTSTTLRPYLSSRRCFRLVDLIISFTIKHLAIPSKLIHCITTCIANSRAARISSAAVPTSPTTTSLLFVSWILGMFRIIWVFQVIHLDSFWCSSIDPGFPYSIVRSFTAKRAPWHAKR